MTPPSPPTAETECEACEIQYGRFAEAMVGIMTPEEARKIQNRLREIDPQHHALIAALKERAEKAEARSRVDKELTEDIAHDRDALRAEVERLRGLLRMGVRIAGRAVTTPDDYPAWERWDAEARRALSESEKREGKG